MSSAEISIRDQSRGEVTFPLDSYKPRALPPPELYLIFTHTSTHLPPSNFVSDQTRIKHITNMETLDISDTSRPSSPSDAHTSDSWRRHCTFFNVSLAVAIAVAVVVIVPLVIATIIVTVDGTFQILAYYFKTLF